MLQGMESDNFLELQFSQNIMNVDCENFHDVRNYIKENKLIQKSEYISFDLEFTGVKFDNNEKERWDMFLHEKYQKMSAVATRFNIIQVGVTFLHPHQEDKSKYVAYPFNFYVFPRENYLIDPVISMQAGCVEFNSGQHMDWNRWIRKGINFVKITQFNKYVSPQKNSFKDLYNYLSIETQSYVDHIISLLEDKEIGHVEKFELPRLVAYQIKKIMDKFSEENTLHYSVSLPKSHELDDKISEITIQLLSKEQHTSNEENKFQKLLGFSLLFQEIWLSKKTFIGHNCLYDILFLYASFIDQLPSSYQNFKNIVSDDRRFYDTKYIASRMEEKSKIFPKGTSLQGIYNFYSELEMDEKLTLAKGFQNYDLKNPALHEAGFDSYLTAWVFLKMSNLEQYEGRINSAKSFYSMNIRQESDELRRDMIVFVVPIAAYNAFVALEELKKKKIDYSKNIRENLLKAGMLNSVAVSEGLKQIFIASKDVEEIPNICKVINKLKEEKKIMNIMSLESWILMRNESQMVSKNDSNKKNYHS